MRLLFKNSIKKIFKSFGRFISISIIIMIGVSVFIGLKEATPGMLYTADNYYDKYNLMDLKITSNYGVSDDDIKAIEKITNVEEVIPSYSADALSNGKSIRINALLKEVNNVYLTEGRMPSNDNECLADFDNYEVGDIVTLDEENSHLKEKKFKVVGLIKSPLYINSNYGVSNIGNGNLNSFIYVSKNVFNYEYYTEAYIIAKGSQELDSYDKEYKELIADLRKDVKQELNDRKELKYNELLSQVELSMEGFSPENIAAIKDEIAKPVWYIFDRNDNSGYQNYKDDALKVEAIAEILPLFFVIVGILMCLNTLTRLIEEERTEIGILQSNGFSKTSIILSYLYYVFSSTIIGLIVGLTVGYTIISKIIYNVFVVNYYLPPYISVVDSKTLILIIMITLIIMMLATIITCNKELREYPAQLLRPKAPKDGKKIFLERFTKTWERLSFIRKVTFRNLFRYKKRIIMTVLGVAGCCALLLTGFGLNDSINVISKAQYNDIIKYDQMIILKNEVKEIPEDISLLIQNNNVNNYLLVNQNSYTYNYSDREESASLIVAMDSNNFKEFVNLESIEDKNHVKLKDDGAVITSQMAEQLGVTVKDNLTIEDSNNNKYKIVVSDIVNNYISHYIYMSPSYYQKVFNQDLKYNTLLINGKINEEIDFNNYNIYGINNTSDIIESFDDFTKSINNLIGLIIVCAALLAFAVLYNLTIINVNERKREIASFKVLGFNDWELFVFIYRETFILTITGILLGLVLGVFLHHYVIKTAQMGNIQFMYNINWYSYVLAFVITILFSLFIQLLINRKLKNIDMIDSLKSVE